MLKLAADELTSFLDEEGHLARIGTVDDDGFPRVLPLWFVRDGRRLCSTPRSPAVIWANNQRDPRVGISIDEDRQPLPQGDRPRRGPTRRVGDALLPPRHEVVGPLTPRRWCRES